MSLTRRPFGDGAERLTLTVSSGASVSISTLGATLVSVIMPDREGRLADVALGYDTAGEYLINPGCVGGTVGRFANRIGHGTFPLDGKRIVLDRNWKGHTLHGGAEGFHRRLWQVQEAVADRVVLQLQSPDGDQGFPGNLHATVACRLSADHVLTLTYTAEADQATVCGLTNHVYWNLAGHDSGIPVGQWVCVPAAEYLETDGDGIPTGGRLPVGGTVFDLQTPRLIDSLLAESGGLDYTGILPGPDGLAGTLWDPGSGRKLTVYTDLPAVQVYTGNALVPGLRGKEGALYGPHGGFCLETEQFPDAPNHPDFPSARLAAGKGQTWQTRFCFHVD